MKIYKYINAVFFGIFLAINPRLWYLMLFKGLYIPVFVQYEWVKRFNIKTIIDVGAHQGRVTRTLHYLFPDAHIYAFEPEIELHSKIKRGVNPEKLTIEPLAVSDTTGEIDFFRYSDATLSSTMPLNIDNIRDGERVVTWNAKTHATTLDDYFNEKKLDLPIFLKIDTEGGEGKVLMGGTNFLKKVGLIHVETYFEKMYKGQMLFDKIFDLLRNYGLNYAGEINEAYFFPSFKLSKIANSIFINNKKL